MVLPILTCPMKPVSEESRLVSPMRANLGDAPANACTKDKCAWWLKLQDGGGQIAGNCAIPVAAVALIGLDMGLRAAIGAVPPAAPATPASN